MRERDLAGQVALVTGGSRGLGLLLTRELAREGCRVAFCARDVDELNDGWRSLQANGVEVVAIPCDVGDQADVARMIAEVQAELGPIGILVNNASIIQVGAVPTLDAGDFEAAMRADFWGTLFPTLAVLPAMRSRRRGSIANVTSIGGRVAAPHVLPYVAAKFAATGFSEGLSAEVARDGVRVTTIVPGFMRTGSYLRARFKPPRRAEFSWFALGSALPLVSVDAERAAREVVVAIKRGDSERSIGLLSTLAWRFHGLYPGFTTVLLGLVNRLLPRPAVEAGPGRPSVPSVSGEVAEREIDSDAFQAVTTLGRRAADPSMNDRSPPPTDAASRTLRRPASSRSGRRSSIPLRDRRTLRPSPRLPTALGPCSFARNLAMELTAPREAGEPWDSRPVARRRPGASLRPGRPR